MASPEIPVEPSQEQLTPEQQKEKIDEVLERQEKLAESQLTMSRLFIERGKIDIARRRLLEILELYAKSDAAAEAKKLLKSLPPEGSRKMPPVKERF